MLTTHSMEEAEALSSRMAIQARAAVAAGGFGDITGVAPAFGHADIGVLLELPAPTPMQS